MYYKSAIKNLWLQLRDDKLVIKNSLHKFYLGNNYEDFAFAKAQHAIQLLDNYFPFSIYDAIVKYYNARKDAIPIYTVQDLVNKENFTRLSDHLMTVYKTIKKKPIILYAALQPKEIKLIAAMNDKEVVKGLKKYHKHSYLLDRKNYSKLLKTIGENPFDNLVIEKIQSKINGHLKP